jgi:alpha-tubulin suppressor-like RCC1 family protein
LSSAEPDCALDVEGRPWRISLGQLERDAGAPAIKGAKSISCSVTHTCVAAEDGSAICWGDNTYGALGDGTEKKAEAPVKVTGLSGVAEVVVDWSRSCARTTGGDVFCWGDREFGKAGDGTLIDNKGREKPLAGKSIMSGATSLGVAKVHACATSGDGSVTCWGQCRSGACGQPPRPPWVPKPAKAPKVKDLASVVAGEDVSCGLDKAGTAWCWGQSRYGALGDGVKDDKPHDAATKIALPSPAAELAVGAGHACARLATGAVHCWGRNEHGELGDGTTTNRPAPAPVKGVEKATRISAGNESTCAIVEGGRLFCWGMKRALDKNGSVADASAPVEIKPAPEMK